MTYLGKVWRGEERLAIVFWGWLIALQIGLGLMDAFFGPKDPVSLDELVTANWIIFALSSILFVWAAVGIWRSGRRAGTAWQILSRIIVVLWSLRFAVILAGVVFVFSSGKENLQKVTESCKTEFNQMVQTKGADPAGRSDYVLKCVGERLAESMLAEHAKAGK